MEENGWDWGNVVSRLQGPFLVACVGVDAAFGFIDWKPNNWYIRGIARIPFPPMVSGVFYSFQ